MNTMDGSSAEVVATTEGYTVLSKTLIEREMLHVTLDEVSIAIRRMVTNCVIKTITESPEFRSRINELATEKILELMSK